MYLFDSKFLNILNIYDFDEFILLIFEFLNIDTDISDRLNKYFLYVKQITKL